MMNRSHMMESWNQSLCTEMWKFTGLVRERVVEARPEPRRGRRSALPHPVSFIISVVSPETESLLKRAVNLFLIWTQKRDYLYVLTHVIHLEILARNIFKHILILWPSLNLMASHNHSRVPRLCVITARSARIMTEERNEKITQVGMKTKLCVWATIVG